MSKIVIVGGKLQGSEAAYLGKCAGIEIILIDKDTKAPSQNLVDKFICGDVLSDDPEVVGALESADMILPTMENDWVLERLDALAKDKGYTLAFDWEAYKISSSKKVSDKLFLDNNLPCPQYYPAGTAPFIAKPDSESGSHGIQYFTSEEDVKKFANGEGKDFIIQEFVEGPSYSVEIIGRPGNYRVYEITEIFVDDVYDCNLAATLHTIDPEKKKAIEKLAIDIAEIINLKGIMDLEVIDYNGEIKILEIDARLPSQTSIVVYHASGMNYIKELYDLFCTGDFQDKQINNKHFASLTHYLFQGGEYSSHGEHIMVEGGLLEYTEGICKDAVVVSDFKEGMSVWRGTFVNYGQTFGQLEEKEAQMRSELKER
ncbi:MAG: 3-methylornithine--L-lysine ligase PylC [Anaerovoracaceae bacterium]